MRSAAAQTLLRVALLGSFALSPPFVRSQTPGAAEALAAGRVHDAEQMLRKELAASPHAAPDLLLLCRVLYAQDRFDEAQDVCQQAADAAPSSSAAQLWLGRVLGARASAAGKSLQAFTLARKVHTAFEHAVKLDGRNAEAMSDLGEYYVSAPGIVGGGVDKARELAPRLLALDTVRGHRLLAQIARKEGDTAAAARELETSAATGSPAALIDLSIFRRRNNQPDLAVDAARRSVQANRLRDESLVDAAAILIDLHRESKLAVRALESYLTSPAKSDAAPAFKVRLQLAAVLRSVGDAAGAQRETAVANQLAPDFVRAHATTSASR